MAAHTPKTALTCPLCHAALAHEQGALRCETHGAFFAYGPQLLVRLPRAHGKQADALMPWENRKRMNAEG